MPSKSLAGRAPGLARSQRPAAAASLRRGEDSVEAAWAVVDPVLEKHHRAHPYRPGSWGPQEADTLIAPHGLWHNPEPDPPST